jgi:membrane protease YdiL (CAAX protease family)
LDDSDQPARPLFTFGAGMRAMLLVALCFGCIGILTLLNNVFPQQIASLTTQSPEIYSVLQALLIFVLPTIIYVNVFPLERFGYFRLHKPVPALTVLIGAIGLVLLLPVYFIGIEAIENSITDPELIKFIESLKVATAMPTVGSFLLCLLVNAFVPAFCEEIFFRAGLQQVLMERFRNPVLPIIISALFFTIFHANPAVMPFIFLSGLLLGFAFYRTGSLRTTIIMHFLFNGTDLFLDFQAQRHLSIKLWTPNTLVILACVLGTALCFFLLWKRTKHSKM